MNQKLISLRVELSKRLADAQVVGGSRELSLAVTSIQSARMLFGSVALLLGSVNPYPEADNPGSKVIHPSADLAADYVPPVLADQVAAVKALRAELQVLIDAANWQRRQLWARSYGSVEELLFDRALVELFLAKQWLGEQLAVLGGHALVKPRPAPVTDTVESVRGLIEGADAKDLAVIAGILVELLADVAGDPEPEVGLERALMPQSETAPAVPLSESVDEKGLAQRGAGGSIAG